jgi:predicted transcriptional regulator
MDRHATVDLFMLPTPPDDLPDDTAEALAEARLRLRNSLIEGATSAPTDPVDPGYFEALRVRVRDEADRRAEAAADAEVEAGRVIPHTRVREWLKALGTPDQQPTPFSWRK